MRRLYKVLRPHAALCGMVAGVTLMSVVVNVFLRDYLGGLLDGIILGPVRWRTVAAVLGTGIVLSVALAYGKSWGVSRLIHSIKSRLYLNTCSFLLYEYQGDVSLGELTSLLSNDVGAVANSVNRIFARLLSDAGFFIVSAGVICAIDPALAVLVVLAAVVPAVVIVQLSKRQREERQQYMRELAEMNEDAAKGLFSLESVKANALEEHYGRRYMQTLAQLLRSRKKMERTQAMITAPSVFCAFFIQIAMIVASGFFTAVGRISAGSFLTVITLMNYIVDPVMSVEHTILSIRALNVSLERLDKLLGKKPFRDIPEAVCGKAPAVELQKVSFGYTPEHPVLKEFSLRLEPGRCHFILGENGSGKSTLIRLLGGVLRPWSGSVFLCGDPPEGPGSLADRLSVMPQEPVLFSDSVLENVRLCQPGVTRQAVEEACRRAGIHDQIVDLPNGYDTQLSENGGILSGGQKQRLSLARTILRDRPVMVFDEPTAALDDGHAAQAAALMKELARDRVVLVITHDARIDRTGGDVIRLGGPDRREWG